MERGHQISIINSEEIPSSSKVAAGLFNPVVFKRLVPSWRANEFVPHLMKRYTHLEKVLNTKFLYSTRISKIIETDNELQMWNKRIDGNELFDFVKKVDKQVRVEGIEDELMLGRVEKSGYVDLKKFLDVSNEFFQKKGLISHLEINYRDIKINEHTIEYGQNSYDAVFFCEGYHVHQNPYFSFLHFKPVNGDVLTLNIPSYRNDQCLNKNFFLLPLHDGKYRLGATYNWSNLVFETNEEAKNALLSRLKEYIKGDIELVQHEAGVRPSSNDRRPILGAHPQHKNLYIFNGLGAKGVMLAPYFAELLADHITFGKELEKEVSVERYYSYNKA